MSKSSTTTGDDPMGLAQMRRAPTHPGVVLVEHLRSADTTQAEAARRLGVNRLQLNHVCVGRRPMSMALCVRIAALTRTSPESWATMQMTGAARALSTLPFSPSVKVNSSDCSADVN